MKINKLTRSNNQDHRKKTDPFYQSGKHRKLREQAFYRDNGLCQEHLRQGKIKQLQLHTTKETRHLMAFGDHKRPREAGGKDELDNYQTLCKKCHDIKSNKDKQYFDSIIKQIKEL